MVETREETNYQFVVKFMNKYLSEIEIIASKSFGEANARGFIDETRGVLERINAYFNRSIESHYGKYVVMIWHQKMIDDYKLPLFEYDETSGVCTRNVPYDLNTYFDMNDNVDKQLLVIQILNNSFSDLPNDVGLKGDEVTTIIEAEFL